MENIMVKLTAKKVQKLKATAPALYGANCPPIGL